MKLIPRYDPPRVDPLGLKRDFSTLHSNTLDHCLSQSIFKDKIVLANHRIECDGPQRDARYRQSKSGKFDGIHLLGPSGSKILTLSVLDILKEAHLTTRTYNSQFDRAWESHRRNPRIPFRNPVVQNRVIAKPTSSIAVTSSIPVYNRFDVLRKISGNE